MHTLTCTDADTIWLVLLQACASGDLALCQNLRTFASVARTSTGDFGLHLAASSGCVPVLQFLLEEQVNVNLAGRRGWTALHYAARSGNLLSVQYLADQGAAINALSDDGSSPLHYATILGAQDIVTELLAYGACTEVKDRRLRTAGQLARCSSLKTLLRTAPPRQQRLQEFLLHACATGRLAAVQLLCARKLVCVHTTSNARGERALHVAACLGHVAIVHHLIQVCKVDVNVRQKRMPDVATDRRVALE